MGVYLTSTDLGGKRPLRIDQERSALDQWAWIHQEILQRFSERHAAIIAEPSTDDDLQFDWYASIDGAARPVTSLSASELEELKDTASQRLDDIKRHGTKLVNSKQKDSLLLGRALLAAIAGLDAVPLETLYSVGGEPVFVNWGVEQTTKEAVQGAAEVGRDETPVPPVEKTPTRVSIHWLWPLFVILSTISFLRLVDGCSLISILNGGVPNYCRAPATTYSPELRALIDERAQLSSELSALNRQLIAPPVCGFEEPAFPLDPNNPTIENPPIEPQTPTSKEPKIDNLSYNELIRDAGGQVCDGIEVLAAWEGEADIDLHLYCPVDAGQNSMIDDEGMVGPGNDEACGAVYDLANDGAAGVKNIERICMSENVETGEYLAAIYHDDENGTTSPTRVELVVRGEGGEDIIALTSVPGAEASDYLPIDIE